MTLQKAQQIIQQATTALLPYARNSRTHSEQQIAQIAASIREFGFTNPVLVDNDNGIVAGHGRVMAAQQLGMAEVPTINVGWLSEAQRRAYVIADNQLALNAGWDESVLAQEVAWLNEQNFSTELLGFDADFLDGLLAEEDATSEGLTDEDAVPEVQPYPISKTSDVWVMGNHRVMCGDSLDVSAIGSLLCGVTPNAVVTDPPYGIGIDGQKKSVSKNVKHNRKHHEKKGWDSERPSLEIFQWIVGLGVPVVIWGGNYFADLLPATRGWLYWSKGQDGLSMSDGELAWTTEDKPLRSKTINRRNLHGSVHPTQKPVQIIKFSVDYLKVPQKGAVLDLFGGSGTLVIVCEKTDRRAFVMERDADYCDVIVRRWQAFTGKRAVLESTGQPFPDTIDADEAATA